MPVQALFDSGRIVSTPGALEAFERACEHPGVYLAKHLTLEQGELCAEDHRENKRAIKDGNRILSAYHLGTGEKIWLITEADRSVTTFLLPEEY